MGSRGRSIRLRIYLLVAVPLVTMIGLLAYIATTSIHNVINLDRAPSLINATSIPTADFVNYLQAERLAAVVYVFEPDAANLANFQAAAKNTDANEQPFINAVESPATKAAETTASAAGISNVLADLKALPQLRQGVEARLIGPSEPMTALDALGAYTKGIVTEPQLFLDEADSMTNATAASQALGLIGTVSARESLSQEDALLSGMLAAGKASPADRAAFTEMVATREADVQDANYLFDGPNLKIWNAALAGTQTAQQQLTQVEEAVAGGVPMARLGITQAQWQGLAGGLLQAYFNGGKNDAEAQLIVDRGIVNAAKDRLYLTASIALLGLLLTIIITTLVGRAIIRRLRGLETTALTLAEQQLPDVVGRLRRGDDVDVAAEAPPMRVGGDEIGRVGQAFDLVRQTAIRSAVEEARLRRGLNDVFRSLARRSQSLLHRQLTLLDQMERRASDPEALDDLFRLDHLTTRMRRHAEGLVILAGAPPGRGWSSPVRMVDVMRGAIAEVEDYARVSVATRSQAALSGSAVADVIHLLAELIENATTLSPPYTSVRVSGDTVANGFAIEVEDRGLGMSAHRLAELNDRLANPPEFNPSDSEQLGLFVVSQLAKRHGIRVTLKASPYGGTEAVMLIPRHLVVTEDAFRASLPGESAAAITMGPAGTNGSHFPLAEMSGGPQFSDGAQLFSDGAQLLSDGSQFPGGSQLPGGPRISGPLRRSQGGIPDGLPRGGHHAGSPGSGANGTSGFAAGNGNGNGLAAASGPAAVPDGEPADLPRRSRGLAGPAGQPPAGVGSSPFDVFSPQRPDTEDPFPDAPAAPDGVPGTPGSTSPFGTGSAPYSSSFPDQPPMPSWPGQSVPPTPMTPIASSGPQVSLPPWELSRETGPMPAVPADAGPAPAADADPADFKGLPRRVRQANIAPQLRADPAVRQRRTPPADTGGGGQAAGPSPDEIRATMSALQRGWQEGRSQRSSGGEPPWEQEAEGDKGGT